MRDFTAGDIWDLGPASFGNATASTMLMPTLAGGVELAYVHSVMVWEPPPWWGGPGMWMMYPTGGSIREIDLQSGQTGPESLHYENGVSRYSVTFAALENGAHVQWLSYAFSPYAETTLRLIAADGAVTEIDNPMADYSRIQAILPIAGGFLMSWSGFSPESSDDAHLQRFDLTGARVGTGITFADPLADSIVVAQQADGDLAVLRQIWSPYEVPQSLDLLIMGLDGEVHNVTAVDTEGAPIADFAVTVLQDGGMVVTWRNPNQSADGASGQSLWLQTFDADGTARTGAISFASITQGETTANSFGGPTVVALDSGDFLVSASVFSIIETMDDWGNPMTQYRQDLPAIIVSGQGEVISEVLSVTGGAEAYGPGFVTLGDGRIVASWLTIAMELQARIIDTRTAAVNLTGNDFANDYLGTQWDDTMAGGQGRDTLGGDAGDDLLQGQGGRDLLEGGAGNDTLAGAGGRDTLIGGAGDDVLRGGVAEDLFVFAEGFGHDKVYGFEQGIDRLDLSALHLTEADIAAAQTLGRHGLVLAFGEDTIMLKGIEALQAGDYIL